MTRGVVLKILFPLTLAESREILAALVGAVCSTRWCGGASASHGIRFIAELVESFSESPRHNFVQTGDQVRVFIFIFFRSVSR